MNFSLFPPSRVLFLSPDGRVEAMDVEAPRLSGTTVVLARERCLFDPIETAVGVSSRVALSAARLRAQTAAPYQNPGYAITRKGRRFGIWWWDADWVTEHLSAAGLPDDATVLPEALFYGPDTTTARILKGVTGFEAQIWEDGFLVADLWRRRAFDEAAWRDFIHQWYGELEASPPLPAAARPPFLMTSPYRRTLVSSLTNEKLLEIGGLGAIAALLVISAYLFGSGLSLRRQADTLRAETAIEQAKAPARTRGQAQINQVIALKRELEHSDPLTLLRNAQEIVLPFGYQINAFSATRRTVSITLPEEAVAGVDLICTELNASPYFSNASPKLDHAKKRLVIEMSVRGAQGLKAPGDGSLS